MIYSFYSYKGGVGRSMTLANLGELFHEKGLRTLLIDWDLEAPGLEAYFYRDQELASSREHLGLIDMLGEYKERFQQFATSSLEFVAPAGSEPHYPKITVDETTLDETTRELLKDRDDVPRFKAAAAQPPTSFQQVLAGLSRPDSAQRSDWPALLADSPFRSYIQCIHPSDHSRENGLFLISAGKRSDREFGDYAAAVQEFDWSEFYAAYNGREFFDWFRERLREIAHVVLIDTRTGVTEMGGVCTRHLPDAILSFCAPNFQNVDGVARIVSGVNGDKVKEARGGREVQAMTVPARIDDSESALLGEFAELFANRLERDEFVPVPLQGLDRPLWHLQVPYIPRYNYREALVIGPSATSRDPVTQKLATAYGRIAVHLAALAEDGERVKGTFAPEIATAFPHLWKGPRQMAPPVPEGWVERPKESEALKRLLFERAQSAQMSRVAVWGFPGTGKTSLVARVCRDPEVIKEYRDGILWLNADRHWTVEEAQSWLSDMLGLGRRLVGEGLQRAVTDRRFLLVVDDVWNLNDVEEPLKFGQRCTQLVITRDLAVASDFLGSHLSDGLVSIGMLDDGQAQQILKITDIPRTQQDEGAPSALIEQLAKWPLGATLLRTSLDRRLAQGETVESAWQVLREAIDRHQVAAFDQLATGERSPQTTSTRPDAPSVDRAAATDRARSAALSLRESVARLAPADKDLLIRIAKEPHALTRAGNPQRLTPIEAPNVTRLKDLGLVQDRDTRALDLHPLVRAYLLSQGEIQNEFSPQGQPRPPGTASDIRDSANPDVQQAESILRGASAALDEIERLADRLRNGRYFGLARRLFARARTHPEFPRLAEPRRLRLVQRHALCTYRDPDLPASRFPDAISILEQGDLTRDNASNETLGLAGAVYKYQWMLTGSRRDLEHSLHFYGQGAERRVEDDQGYTAINAAFVLDVLAKLQRADAPDVAAQRKDKARALRERIITVLPGLPAQRSFAWLRNEYWFYATLAEACFGLSRHDEARYWLREGLPLEPPQWELESTSRQLVALADAQEQDLSAGSDAYRTLRLLVGDAPEALRAMTMGKVGIALSGGGFRASFFHIGVLARLAELDVLRHVDVLSCVSGGSIIGAQYYLEVRRLLQQKPDREITRADYLDIIRRLERDFMAGVRKNIRTRLFAGWWANLWSLVNPYYTRTVYLGNLLERHLYRRVDDGHIDWRRSLDELRIRPQDGPDDFNPKLDNWRRSAKGPILLLNATTLNTGHNWQFSVSWMGEPPSGLSSQIDQNDILRRMYYRDAPPGYQKVRLGQAVAASACVPSLFDPIQFDGLFPDPWSVRLVDGGVHDNQGIAGLLEQQCTVILVSDASGQTNTEERSSVEVLNAALRTNNILMARVREAQLRELETLSRAEALRGFVFLHLKRDLDVEQLDWIECQDPYSPVDQPTAGLPRATLTSYGIPKTVQQRLAGIRTDLDSFSEPEAYALMLSGYRMAKTEIKRCLPSWSQLSETAEPWRFLDIEDIVTRAPGVELAHATLLRQLSVSAQRGFKVWRLIPAARAIAVILAAAILLAISSGVNAVAQWPYWMAALAVILGASVIGLLLVAVCGIVGGLIWLVHRRFRPRKSFTVIVTGLLMVTIGCVLARAHLWFFDPLYRSFGKVPRSRRSVEQAAQP